MCHSVYYGFFGSAIWVGKSRLTKVPWILDHLARDLHAWLVVYYEESVVRHLRVLCWLSRLRLECHSSVWLFAAWIVSLADCSGSWLVVEEFVQLMVRKLRSVESRWDYYVLGSVVVLPDVEPGYQYAFVQCGKASGAWVYFVCSTLLSLRYQCGEPVDM